MSCWSFVLGGGAATAAVIRPASLTGAAHPASTLHVEGVQLMRADGRAIALHGVNIGGWLVTEDWMCGFEDSADTKEANGPKGVAGRFAFDDLEKRFGEERAGRLTRAWQDHWITAADLDLIRDSGFNLIRVPFSFRTLQHADGSWIRDVHGDIDFSRMDWIVNEAAKRGVYTIFDLHVWPDQRQDYDKIGRPEGAQIRAAMAQLWTAVALHYRGEGAIAAFDLINEFPGNWGVQQVLAQAVQAGDPRRIQVIEGFALPEFLRLRSAGSFPNSVFSDHIYGAKPLSTVEVADRLKPDTSAEVPIYIGEFLAADFPAATHLMNAQQAAWSSWTYKTVDMGDWGVFNYYSSVKTNIQNDTYDDILSRWTKSLTAWQEGRAARSAYVEQDRRLADRVRGPLV